MGPGTSPGPYPPSPGAPLTGPGRAKEIHMNDATNLIYLLALAGTVVLMLGIGVWVARRNRSGEDFLLAGRSLSTPLLLGTTLATLVGTGSSLGAVGFAYENGWAGGLYGIGGAVGVLLLL